MKIISKCRLAVFASGSGTNFSNLKDHESEFNFSVELLISNNSKAGVMQRADNSKTPKFHISSKTHNDPDQEILKVLKEYKIDLIALCGYMKKVPGSVIQEFEDRILNVHPALLPKFGGQGMFGDNVHKAVLDNNEYYSGATIHLVNEEYDKGRILNQDRVEIINGETIDSLSAKVRKIEFELYPKTIKSYWEEIN